MKIAHFPGSFFPNIGGAEISVYNIATAQSKMNNDVTLILYPYSFRYFKKEKINCDFKIECIYPFTRLVYNFFNKFGLNLDFIFVYQINKLQKGNKFDIWHFSLLDHFSLIAINALKKYDVKIVATFRGSDIQKNYNIKYGLRLDEKYERALINSLPAIDYFTAISETVIDEYKKLKIDQRKISLIPNGIDFSRFNYIENNPSIFNHYFEYDHSKKVLLTVGRNHPKKGFDKIEYIINCLKNIRSDFIWLIVGKDTYKIVEKIQDIDNLKYIRTIDNLHGTVSNMNYPQEELIKIYKASHLFVFPTIIETLGNVQIEAMAANIPVISSDVEGCKNVITSFENGILCDPMDFNAFAKSIDLLLSDKSLRKKLIGNAKNRIKMLNIENIVNQYLKIYKN